MSNTPTYLFYDIETTGLNKCFDQVLQFAAIRTDLSLNELSREEIHVKLNNDVIPSPYAVITHRIGPSEFNKGLNEFEAMQKIHALLNTPHTISVGYNSLGFDDEFLRFSFYKNLLSPYTHQFSNQCGRMDIYPMTLLYYLFKPDTLHWPQQNNTVSLKLENLNIENQFFNGPAHNAMVDVEVTLALARKLHQDSTMWSFVTHYFQKKDDESRIQDCETTLTINNTPYKMGLMAHGKLGSALQFMSPVVSLGKHAHYKNQTLWLRLDDQDFEKINPNDGYGTTKIIRKRLGEPPLFLPLKERYFSRLSYERKNLVENNQAWLERNADAFNTITHHHQHEKYPHVPERDVDAALYDIGFPTHHEEQLFQTFHTAKPYQKYNIANKFPNDLRKTQALRILGRHFPDTLSPEQKMLYTDYLKAIDSDEQTPVDFRGEKKLTRRQALHDIETLQTKETLDSEQRNLLTALSDYLNTANGTY